MGGKGPHNHTTSPGHCKPLEPPPSQPPTKSTTSFPPRPPLPTTRSACYAQLPSASVSVNSLPAKNACEDPPGKEGITIVFITNLTACASAAVALWAGNIAGAAGALLVAVAVVLGAAMLYVASGLQVRYRVVNVCVVCRLNEETASRDMGRVCLSIVRQ